MAVAASLPAGPGFGASSAELGTGAVTAAPHPGSLPDQASVLGIGAPSGHDLPIPPLLLALGTGAGLAGAGGRHHHGGGSVTPEGHVTLGNTWNRGRALALSFKKR
jgi:hypothetical protein